LFVYATETDGYFLSEYTKALKQVGESDWMTFEKFNGYYRLAASNYMKDTTPEKTFWNAEHHNFWFDINKSQGLGGNGGNASFKEYLDAKMKAYKEYVK
jgi:hypothetical protein